MEITVVFTEQLYVKNVLLQKLWRELPQMWFLNPQVGVYTLMWKICEQQHVKYFTISKKKKSQHAEAVCKTLNTPLPLP